MSGGGAPAGPVLVIVGPTAAGKSEIACGLARRFGGWILSVDSMALYRGLDIGTAKPSAALQAAIPHRGLDLVEPDQDCSLGDFIRAADASLAEMRAAGARPILVGGTGLYLRGVLKGVADLPRRDPDLRRRLLEEEAAGGPGTLHRRLVGVDPASAQRIRPADIQRVVRAMELASRGILGAVGRKGPEWSGPDRLEAIKIGVTRRRSDLAGRIERRVDDFLAAGLVEETRGLLRRYPGGGNAFKALGYREVAAHLRGELDLPTARALIIRNTLRYAKRQMTWFRKEDGVRWFEIDGPAEDWLRIIGDHAGDRLGSSVPPEPPAG